TSLTPVFTLRGLRINNPEGFSQETFVSLDLAKIRLDLVALLQKKIHLSEISVQKLHVTLEKNKKGDVNWGVAAGDKPIEEDKPEKDKAALAGDTLVVSKLLLEDIVVHYYDPDNSEPSRYQIDKCLGSMLPGKPLELDMSGSLTSTPYTLAVNIASLEEFLTENRSWMEIKAEIAGTKLLFKGDINLAEAHRSLALKGSVSGENLNTLNNLLHLDLPPMGPYGVEADLLLKKNYLEMKNLVVKTGSSGLNGTAQITKGEGKTEAKVEFISPLIQIDDFIFDDWSWSKDDEPSSADNSGAGHERAAPVTDKDDASGGNNRKLLDPDVLDNFDIALSLHSEKVLLGEEELGSGSLKATLRNGRIAIEPLKLNVPGGSVELSASLKPGNVKSDASLRAVMSNFDIGILARRSKPESKMGGMVNLDVDLQSSAASFDQILANGNGYFDFSGQLTNLSAGIIDLWAVNLIAAIVSSTDENESNINCAVGRWQVNDGSLTPDIFFIDTSKIRICGSGEIDFVTNRIDLIISPTAKKAEFFSLATPLEVHGNFSDIQFGIKKGGVVGTVAKFITSPIVVPIKRTVSKEIPEDGSDACSVILGPDNRSELTVKGCK
ncbi:MAG: AsmA family protein, partial [Deltaproteobacteria bacterium]|nr:AsmA family protein [Deltaproteobacteria bacterium]